MPKRDFLHHLNPPLSEKRRHTFSWKSLKDRDACMGLLCRRSVLNNVKLCKKSCQTSTNTVVRTHQCLLISSWQLHLSMNEVRNPFPPPILTQKTCTKGYLSQLPKWPEQSERGTPPKSSRTCSHSRTSLCALEAKSLSLQMSPSPAWSERIRCAPRCSKSFKDAKRTWERGWASPIMPDYQG